MAVHAQCITDPACVWSWAVEPAVRALMVEFGDGLEWTFVMGGLARDFDAARRAEIARAWLDAAAESGMPTDPRVWHSSPPVSSYPACLAVKAAQEQCPDMGYRVLRALREALICRRVKLDHTEALAAAARDAGADEERFRIDLASHAIVEAFGSDLDRSRDVPAVVRTQGATQCSQAVGEERVPFPTFRFEGEGGELGWSCGWRSVEHIRAAALEAGAEPDPAPRPTVREAFERFGRLAAPEVLAICDLSPTRAGTEVAALAAEGRIRPVAVLAGTLWEAV